MPAAPWTLETGLEAVLARWRSRGSVRACTTADERLPAEPAALEPLPADLAPGLAGALRERGVTRLYGHQTEALAHARTGRHVVVATPTASGKSLCFHVPVLDRLAREPGATALYLYPTKALARDQEASLRALARDAGLSAGAIVYDGDTPGDARRSARAHASLLLTNPDMLHAGILPQHPQWARLFASLRYVIVDELHTYRGVFGSHVAHVLGRLRRVAAFHGAAPTFLGATATIGNPREHAARLFGLAPEALALVDRSGAPRPERTLVVYNPPVVNAELGVRASYLKSAVRLAADLLEARVRTLVFGQSRNAVEIMLKYLRDRFAQVPEVRESIVSYRAGYLPGARRRVERGLREGTVLGVVATSALELGIDVGELDAVVCAGYPGTLAETWQRFGRAGRRGAPALALLVASSAALDQYLAHHPRWLREGAIEHARIDPENTEILVQHLKCAAFELPFAHDERFGSLSEGDTAAALGFLAEHGVVHASGGRFHWSADAFPANHVSLRRVGWDNTVIIDVASDDALAELDWHATPGMLHEQAIYQHEGVQYQVERLDHDNHKAFVRRVEPDYFTTALRERTVSVLGVEARAALGAGPEAAESGWGDVCVVEKVVGYKKVKFHTHENAGYGEVRLPDLDLHTTSFWLTVPEAARARLADRLGPTAPVEGLRGLATALEIIATLALMCDARDLGQAIGDAPGEPADPARPRGLYRPTAFLFDAVPGGVGLAERIFERARDLCAEAVTLVAACPCDEGCPCCVGATLPAASDGAAGTEILPRRKRACLALAAEMGLARL
jgi:DEAD/DEAH box helicase domain-containing protein